MFERATSRNERSAARRWPGTSILAFTVALAFLAAPSIASTDRTEPNAMAPHDAANASAFLDSIGVNTHLNMPDKGPTGTSYDNLRQVARELELTGIRHVRDTLFIGGSVGRLRALHDATGVRFDLAYDNYARDADDAGLTAALRNVATIADLLEGLEGTNEPDWFGAHFDGRSGAAAVIAVQHRLWSGRAAIPALAAVPVLCPALSNPAPGGMADRLGGLGPVCDVSTSHDYVENHALGVLPIHPFLALWSRLPLAFAPDKALAITEGGWNTGTETNDGVDEAAQATGLIDYLLDAYALGIGRTYVYELAEEAPDPGGAEAEHHYGLFHFDGTPKPAALAIGRLHALLAPGSGAHAAGTAGGTLAYALDGMPLHAHTLLLGRGRGQYALVLWQDASPRAGRRAHGTEPVAPARVAVRFGEAVDAVRASDPLRADPPATLPTVNGAVTVTLADHPVVLLVSARPAAATPSAT